MTKKNDGEIPKKVLWENDLQQCAVESYKGALIHNKRMPDQRGALVVEIVTRWGAVAGVPDGEDSSGRAKLRLQTVEEMTDRACKTVDAIYAEFEKRGWMVELGDYDKISDMMKAIN